MKKLTLLTLGATASLAFAIHSQAQTVTSVQFNTYNEALNAYGQGYGENLSAGEGIYDVTDWNTYATTARAGVPITLVGGTEAGAYTFPNGTTSLIDSAGAAQNYGFSITYGRGDNTGSTADGMSTTVFYANTGDNNQALAGSGIGATTGAGDNVPNLTLALTGLSSTDSYDVIEYVSGLFYASGADTWSEGSTSYYVNPTNGTGLGSWVQGTSTDSANPTSANFVEFTGLTTSNGDLTFTGTGNAAAIMGFQIIDLGPESSAVPEPSTWAMMLGGLSALVFFVRRKGALL